MLSALYLQLLGYRIYSFCLPATTYIPCRCKTHTRYIYRDSEVRPKKDLWNHGDVCTPSSIKNLTPHQMQNVLIDS